MVDDPRRPKKVLVVEPSPEVREGLASLLSGFGYLVSEASDARSGVSTFAEGGIDLVLMEMSGRPGSLDGPETIRSAPGGDLVPLIALVQTEEVGSVAGWLDAGCDDFLLKPVSPRLLFQRIQALLESNPRAYSRVACNVVAEVTTGSQASSGTLREIGEGGAGLLLEEKLTPGDILKVTFPLPRHPEELVVGGEIIYVADMDDQFLHGLRFIIIDTGTREKIRGFVAEALKAKG